MWTRPSSKRDSASSTASHRRKSESTSKSSRSRRDRSPSYRPSRADDRDDDSRIISSSIISGSRIEPLETSSTRSTTKQHEASEGTSKSRRRDRDEAGSIRKEGSRSVSETHHKQYDDISRERKKSSSSSSSLSKDKARSHSYIANGHEDNHRASETRRSTGTSRALDENIASTVPNQFPGQVPLDYSASAFEGSGYVGAAADYYGDHNAYLHAVATQPGVRPHTPIVTGTEPHLMAPLAEPAPPEETGAGAALEFYSGGDYAEQSTGVNQDLSQPSRLSSSSVLAGAADLATGAALLGQASSSNRPASSNPLSSRPGSSKPTKQSSASLNSGLYALGTAAVAGLTTAEIHHLHHQHSQSGKPSSGGYASVPSYATVSNRRNKGPLDTFVDWWKDYEDVRKFEEYTEYIGVCKYCFDPSSTVWEAPRPHRPSRRNSREFRKRTRVAKDTRYHISDDESRHSKRASLGLAAGAASAVAGYSAVQASRSRKDTRNYDDYKSLSGSRRDTGAVSNTWDAEDNHIERRNSGRSTRDYVLSHDKQTPLRSRTSSKDTSKFAAAGSVPASISRRKSQDEVSIRSSSSSASSDAQPSGFFAKLFSPNVTKSKRVRRKRSGKFYGMGNTSIDTGLAYGGGASTLSVASNSSRRKLRRRSSDIDPTKTLLALGGATAALAATQVGSGPSTRRDVFASREPRHGIPPPVQQIQRYKRKDQEDGWESASEEDDDAQSVDSGLAFGHTIVPSSSSESLSSSASGTDKWSWRWGNKNKKHDRSREGISRPSQSNAKRSREEVPQPRLEHFQGYDRATRASGSRRVSGDKPLQVIDPIPVSDLGGPTQFDHQRHLDIRPILTSPPRDMPIQHPKPRSPPKSVPFTPPDASQAVALNYQERRKRPGSTSASPPLPQPSSIKPLTRVFTEPVKSSGRDVAKDIRPRRRSNSGADIRDLALAGGVAAATAGILAMNRRQSGNSVQAASAPKKSLREDSDHSEAERLERERRREKRRQDRASQPPVRLHEDTTSEFPRYVDSSAPSASNVVVYNKSDTTISPSDSASQVPSRQDYVIEHYEVTPDAAASKATEPIFDDDVDDPNFFKKRNRTPSEPREVDDTSKVFNDFTARYAEKPTSQAEFFAPTDLLNGPSPLSTREADFNFDDQVDRASSRADIRTAVPRLNIIAPTPPGSVSGRSGRRSASTSPLRQSVVADDNSEKDFIASRVRWGDSEVNVYQVESPESLREQEYFPDSSTAAGNMSQHVSVNNSSAMERSAGEPKNGDEQADNTSSNGFKSTPKQDDDDESARRSWPSMKDVQMLQLEQSRDEVSVFDYQVSTSDNDEQPANPGQEEWAPVIKQSKKDKKTKRQSLNQDKDQKLSSTRGAMDFPQDERQEQSSDAPTGRDFVAPKLTGDLIADVYSQEEDDASKDNAEDVFSLGTRSMPGSFDSDQEYSDQPPASDEPQAEHVVTQSSGKTPLEERDIVSKSKVSANEFQFNLPEEPARSSRSNVVEQDEWNETSGKKKKKTKKERRKSEQQAMVEAEPTLTTTLPNATTTTEPDEWEVPVSSKKKKKKSTKTKRSARQDDSDEAPERATKSSPQDNGSATLDFDKTRYRDPEDGRAVRSNSADIVSSASKAQESRDNTTSSTHASYVPTTSMADIVSAISAPVFSNKKHYERSESEDPISIKSAPLALSEPEDESRVRKNTKTKGRSHADPLDLAQLDDYTFHAPSLERKSTDNPDSDRKSSKKDKKDKKSIFSFLDKKLSEDLRSSKSTKSSDIGAREEPLATSESSRKAKRRSTGDFDDVDSTTSRHISQSNHPERASASRSRSSTERRRSADETGTKSRTKNEFHDIDTRVDLQTQSKLPIVDDSTIAELTPLPDSCPTSPVVQEEKSEDVVFPLPARPPSSTAVPLRFRRPPVSPIISREPAIDVPTTPDSPSTPLRRRSSRPPSTEFKISHEFRPLYLLESTRRIPDPDENLPSLPSSRTTSRSSSVQGGSDDQFESARGSPESTSDSKRGLGITTDYDSFQEEAPADLLGSGQTTPRAGAASPRSSTQSAMLHSSTGGAKTSEPIDTIFMAVEASSRSQPPEMSKDESDVIPTSTFYSSTDVTEDTDIVKSGTIATESASTIKPWTQQSQGTSDINGLGKMIPSHQARSPSSDQKILLNSPVIGNSLHNVDNVHAGRPRAQTTIGPEDNPTSISSTSSYEPVLEDAGIHERGHTILLERERFIEENNDSPSARTTDIVLDTTRVSQSRSALESSVEQSKGRKGGSSVLAESIDEMGLIVADVMSSKVTTSDSVVEKTSRDTETTTSLQDHEPSIESSANSASWHIDYSNQVKQTLDDLGENETLETRSELRLPVPQIVELIHMTNQNASTPSLENSQDIPEDDGPEIRRDIHENVELAVDQFDPFQYMVEQEEEQGQHNDEQHHLQTLKRTDLPEENSSDGKGEASILDTESLTRISSEEQTSGTAGLEPDDSVGGSEQRPSKKGTKSRSTSVPRDKSSDKGWFSSFFGPKKLKSGIKTDPKTTKKKSVTHSSDPDGNDRTASSEEGHDSASMQEKATLASSTIPESEDDVRQMRGTEKPTISTEDSEKASVKLPHPQDHANEQVDLDTQGLTTLAKSTAEQRLTSQADSDSAMATPSKKNKKKAKKGKRGSNHTPASHSYSVNPESQRTRPRSSNEGESGDQSAPRSPEALPSSLENPQELQVSDGGVHESKRKTKLDNQDEGDIQTVTKDDSEAKNVAPHALKYSAGSSTESRQNEARPGLVDARADDHGKQSLNKDAEEGEMADFNTEDLYPIPGVTILEQADHLETDLTMGQAIAYTPKADDDIWNASSSRKKDKKRKKNKQSKAPDHDAQNMISEILSATTAETGRQIQLDSLISQTNLVRVAGPDVVSTDKGIELQSNEDPEQLVTTPGPAIKVDETSVDSISREQALNVVDEKAAQKLDSFQGPEAEAEDEWSVPVAKKKKGKKGKRQASTDEAVESNSVSTTISSGFGALGTGLQVSANPGAEISSTNSAFTNQDVRASEAITIESPIRPVEMESTSADRPEGESGSNQHLHSSSASDIFTSTIASGLIASGFDAGLSALQDGPIDDDYDNLEAVTKKSKGKDKRKKKMEVLNRADFGDESSLMNEEENGYELKTPLSVGDLATGSSDIVSTTLADKVLDSPDHEMSVPGSDPRIRQDLAIEEARRAGMESKSLIVEVPVESVFGGIGRKSTGPSNDPDNSAGFNISVSAGTPGGQDTMADVDINQSRQDKREKKNKKGKKHQALQKDGGLLRKETLESREQNVSGVTSEALGDVDVKITSSGSDADQTKASEPSVTNLDIAKSQQTFGFEDIVLAAMGDAGFDTKSVVRENSQERVENDQGIMDFVPADAAVTADKERTPSPSSIWAHSAKSNGSKRNSRRSSPGPDNSSKAVVPVEHVDKTDSNAGIGNLGLSKHAKSVEDDDEPHVKNKRSRDEILDMNTDNREDLIGSELRQPEGLDHAGVSWSFANLDNQPRLEHGVDQGKPAQESCTIDQRPLNTPVEGLRESAGLGKQAPNTPKAVVAEGEAGSPAESLTTTKNRSSGLFKTPPSNRNSMIDTNTSGAQVEVATLQPVKELEHSPKHKDLQSVGDATPSEQGMNIPEQLRHLRIAQDYMSTSADADAAPTVDVEALSRHDPSKEHLSDNYQEAMLGMISPDLNQTPTRGSSQTRAKLSSDPTSDVANTRRAYASSASGGLRSPSSELIYSLGAVSKRSTTPSSTGSRSVTPALRRVDRSISSDLRGASERGALAASGVSETDEAREMPALSKTPTPGYQPLKGAGKDRRQDMSEPGSNLEAWSAPALSSPRSSPSRPPSIRKRQSTHILDLERRLDQLASENRALQESRASRSSGDNFFPPAAIAQEALKSRDIQLQEKDVEINSIKASLETLQAEVSRLTRHNAELQSSQDVPGHDESYALLEAKHGKVHEQWQASARELEALQQKHDNLSRGMENVVREEIAAALAEKDQEIQGLRAELDQATDKIQHLQHQISQTRRSEEYLNVRDEDYFDSACQQLCQHVQQWVLRYSKFSDTRVCRLSHQVRDEKIETRLDNAILDGSDVDEYLSDRVRRRDVFMSVVMTMIWEFVFTRYLFGMDRDQRQKLKALEKTLTEVGPARAVAQWRATTLTLLSRRDVFIEQRAQDTEAVVQEIYSTLSRLLPAPSHLAEQIQESLRNVMRLAVNLSIEMRTQRAEYIMLPPLQPEYDTNGELARKVFFNASLMNERSGETTSNEELENQQVAVRLVLFPLVVKKGNDLGESDEEVVVCPAQVLVARSSKEKKAGRVMMSGQTNASMYSVVPSGEHLDQKTT